MGLQRKCRLLVILVLATLTFADPSHEEDLMDASFFSYECEQPLSDQLYQNMLDQEEMEVGYPSMFDGEAFGREGQSNDQRRYLQSIALTSKVASTLKKTVLPGKQQAKSMTASKAAVQEGNTGISKQMNQNLEIESQPKSDKKFKLKKRKFKKNQSSAKSSVKRKKLKTQKRRENLESHVNKMAIKNKFDQKGQNQSADDYSQFWDEAENQDEQMSQESNSKKLSTKDVAKSDKQASSSQNVLDHAVVKDVTDKKEKPKEDKEEKLDFFDLMQSLYDAEQNKVLQREWEQTQYLKQLTQQRRRRKSYKILDSNGRRLKYKKKMRNHRA